jgi:hypothetical protein
MTSSQLPAITIGVWLLTLPTALTAQPRTAQPDQPAAPNTTAPASADSGWTTASPAAPSATAAQPPAPASTPAQTTPAPAETNAPPPAPAATQTPIEPARSDEPPTLFGSKSLKVGGYGTLGVRYARINGEDGALSGIEGALLLDHRFAIGFAGYGWGNQQRITSKRFIDQPYLHFGYGGLLFRYHVYIPNSPVYFSGAALVGGGVVGLTNTWDGDLYRENSDAFFIVEPQLGVHINFTRWMRMGIDAGYRVTSGIGKFDFTESDFNGVSLGGNIGFGWF